MTAIFPAGVDPATDDESVRAAITGLAEGAARQDADLLDVVLYPTSVQFIAGPELTRMERAEYLDLIRSKKAGGLPLAVDIHRVAIAGETACADVTFTSSKYTLTHALSLAAADGRWVVVSSVVHFQLT